MGIQLKYRCACGEHSFEVRYRRPKEDLIVWMESVVRPGMGEAHFKTSPMCMMQSCDLMIPINEAAEGLGLEVKH